MISILVLTKNEESNIARCLESVKWSDDITVLDDGSTDATTEIARNMGARVIVHSAGNERGQRTYSLSQIDFKYRWVYNPDADEVSTAELHDEMLDVVSDRSRREVAYRVRYKNMFMGKWIKHSSLYPTWIMRLFQPNRVSFERTINLRYMVDGSVGHLNSHFLHFSFNKGLNKWLEKHNCYAGFEAQESISALHDGNFDWRGLFASDDAVRRRAALKQVSFRLPCRPTLRFVYMYLLRGGFLDGSAGLTYCRLLSMYEYMIVLKMQEIRRRERGQSV